MSVDAPSNQKGPTGYEDSSHPDSSTPLFSTSAPLREKVVARLSIIALSVLGVAFLLWSLQGVELRSPGLRDFLGLYTGGMLAGTSDLYSEKAAWTLQDRLVGSHSTSTIFIRLPFCALLFKPLTLFSYEMALRIWRVCTLVLFLATLWMFPGNRCLALCMICWSLPAAFCLLNGQDTALLLLCLAVSLRLHTAGRLFLAGLFLAFCLAKFYLLVFVPMLLIVQRQWRVASGLAVAGVALLALSFALQGPAWPVDYLRVISGSNSQPSPDLMFNVRGAFLRSPLAACASQIHAVASVTIAWLLLLIVRHRSFGLALCCCLLGALLVSPHVYNQDYLLALPLCIVLFAHAPALRLLTALFAAPTAYIFSPVAVLIGALLLAAVALSAPCGKVSFEGRLRPEFAA